MFSRLHHSLGLPSGAVTTKWKEAMAFIPVPGVVEVTPVFRQDSQEAVNVLHVRPVGAITPAAMTAIASIYAVWWIAAIKPIAAPNLSLQEVRCRNLTTESAGGVSYTTGLPSAGTVGSGALPNAVTLAVKWSTGLVGRSFRGRTYHLGLSEIQVTDNTVEPVALAALLNAYDELREEYAAQDYPMVVVSRFTNNAPRVTGIATPITTVTINNIVDVQRRRLPGRGN